MRDEAEWSRKLAFAFSQYRPEPKIRAKLLAEYENAKTPSDLPNWFKDFVESGTIEN